MAKNDRLDSVLRAKEEEKKYAEGQREASTCRHCGSPIWIIYHGWNRNHTTEPRDDRKN